MNQGVTRESSRKKREQILRAAQEVFFECGLDGASMDSITAKAKVSKRTVYAHFSSKQALFHAMIASHWEKLTSQENINIDINKPIREALTGFANAMLAQLLSHTSMTLIRLLILESGRHSELLQGLIKKGQAPLTRKLIGYFDEMTARGVLNIQNTTLAATQLMGLIKEDIYWHSLAGFHKIPSQEEQTVIINSALDVFLTFYNQ